jgi:hypothetical protein
LILHLLGLRDAKEPEVSDGLGYKLQTHGLTLGLQSDAVGVAPAHAAYILQVELYSDLCQLHHFKFPVFEIEGQNRLVYLPLQFGFAGCT